MSGTPVDDEILALVRLRVDFPGHRIWRSVRRDGRPGDWVATLRDPAAGVDPTVISRNAESLRRLLEEQRALAAKPAEVW